MSENRQHVAAFKTWGPAEAPSKALRDAALAQVADALTGTPASALHLRWHTDRRVLMFSSSAGSLLAVVNVDAGTIRYSARLMHLPCGATVATFNAALAVEAAAAIAEATIAAPEPGGHTLDLDNGATRMAREVRAAFGADNG